QRPRLPAVAADGAADVGLGGDQVRGIGPGQAPARRVFQAVRLKILAHRSRGAGGSQVGREGVDVMPAGAAVGAEMGEPVCGEQHVVHVERIDGQAQGSLVPVPVERSLVADVAGLDVLVVVGQQDTCPALAAVGRFVNGGRADAAAAGQVGVVDV